MYWGKLIMMFSSASRGSSLVAPEFWTEGFVSLPAVSGFPACLLPHAAMEKTMHRASIIANNFFIVVPPHNVFGGFATMTV